MTRSSGSLCGDQSQEGSCHHMPWPQNPDLPPPCASCYKGLLCSKSCQALGGDGCFGSWLSLHGREEGNRDSWFIMPSAAALLIASTVPFLSMETQLAGQHWHLLQPHMPVFKDALAGIACSNRRSSCSENGSLLLKTQRQIFVCYKCKIKIKWCLTRLHSGLE